MDTLPAPDIVVRRVDGEVLFCPETQIGEEWLITRFKSGDRVFRSYVVQERSVDETIDCGTREGLVVRVVGPPLVSKHRS